MDCECGFTSKLRQILLATVLRFSVLLALVSDLCLWVSTRFELLNIKMASFVVVVAFFLL